MRRQHQKSPKADRNTGPAPSSPPGPADTSGNTSSNYPPQPAPLTSNYPTQSSSSHGASSYPLPSEPRAPPPYQGPKIDRRAPSEVGLHEQLPLINSLPNGTNVVIIEGQPKQPPWTIRDVEPRHHLLAGFESMPPNLQYDEVEKRGYTPYDNHGNPVILHQYEGSRGIRHVFRDDPEWEDPVVNNVRMDDPFRKRPKDGSELPRPR